MEAEYIREAKALCKDALRSLAADKPLDQRVRLAVHEIGLIDAPHRDLPASASVVISRIKDANRFRTADPDSLAGAIADLLEGFVVLEHNGEPDWRYGELAA